ncbi:8-amino-7-oxononanoate synthase [Moraxella caviae]|uniref:8-amino-7-oxononanoate synthase n=1 Tax=Moraxella caviae TaxID=34060 RepID=A0A1T0A6S8_9GAMM|nr:8-amino-7-oxononanoate synthase [Moraxella caviae]OOR91360.1 8-amino-7-oxononanoate synthase [Moraxella caviae]STZ13973.1 8-amino-7-oxononanoate synthase [Moraxella caviae]VEW11489.1 8-amino-7-oxononanoate synthase [Moraxella caviae]VEW12987.1 8-amino-7-oxononanoate synthase [Moraxella caviae]
MDMLSWYENKLNALKCADNHRAFSTSRQADRFIYPATSADTPPLLNLASNDYLGLASDTHLRQQFFTTHSQDSLRLSASSSRLLTGTFDEHSTLEKTLADTFSLHAKRTLSALTFNSGYHANVGILPAISDSRTLILADKLVHASIIDGILLSKAAHLRYPHQDCQRLTALIDKHYHDYERIIIATESVFSMDGDVTDLKFLVNLKNNYPKISLYVDEAHAIAVRGKHGLGIAEEQGVLGEIDFLVGAFGKTMASVGGFCICHPIIKDYLINAMRPLIFSTALPPINAAWTRHVFDYMLDKHQARTDLQALAMDFIAKLHGLGFDCPSQSHIIPVIIGDNRRTLEYAKALKAAGFYVLAVRPPTVPKNQARLRICLNSHITQTDIDKLLNILENLKNKSL